MRIGRGARSTSRPSRARSYSRRPCTLRADTIGGTCSETPRNFRAASSTCSRVNGISARSRTAPDASSVSVAMPKTMRARYDLPVSCRKRISRVTRPRPTSSTPGASGSSVPAWRTLRCPYTFRNFPTTSCDVHPGGLSTTTRPSFAARARASTGLQGGEDALDDGCGRVVTREAGREPMAAATLELGDVAYVDLAHRPQAHAPGTVGRFLQHACDVGLARAPYDIDQALDLLVRDVALRE